MADEKTKRAVTATPVYNQPRYGYGYAARGGDISHDARQLLRGLGKLVPALQEHADRYLKEEAASDIAAGKEPQRRAAVYMESFNRLTAVQKAGEFSKQLSALATDPNMTLGQWEQSVASGLDERTRDQQPGFLTEFMPMAIHVIQQNDAVFTKNFQDRERDKNLAGIGEAIAGIVDPAMNNTAATAEGNAKLFREWTDKLIGTGKGLRLSTKEVSEAVLDRIGFMAIENGRPDLLDYVKIKDTSGISIEDAFPDKVFSYRVRAQNAKDALDTQTKKARDEQLKQMKNTQLNNIMVGIAEVDTTDVKAMNALRTHIYALRENRTLTPAEFRPILNAFETLRDNIGFGHRTNEFVYSSLYTDAKNGRLNWEKLQGSLASLTQDDFREIIKAHAQFLSTTYDKSASKDKQMDDHALYFVQKMIGAEEGTAFPEAWNKAAWVETKYHEKKDEWMAENPGKSLGQEARKKIAFEALQDILKAEEMLGGIDWSIPYVTDPMIPQEEPVSAPAGQERTPDLEVKEVEKLLDDIRGKEPKP